MLPRHRRRLPAGVSPSHHQAMGLNVFGSSISVGSRYAYFWNSSSSVLMSILLSDESRVAYFGVARHIGRLRCAIKIQQRGKIAVRIQQKGLQGTRGGYIYTTIGL